MEDSQILDLFFARSEQAIEELDIKYGSLCRKLSNQILNDPLDAEECVNDSYLGMWNAIPPQRPCPLRSFLCRIVRNLSIHRYHANRAAKRSSPYDIALSELPWEAPAPDLVEDQVQAKALARLIEGFLDTQPVRDRVIFLRRYWFCDSYDAIARQVGMTPKNVSVRLTRLRRRLKDYLTQEGVFS